MLFCVVFILSAGCSENKPKKKKDIRDYNDADMARLLEQWEVMRLEQRLDISPALARRVSTRLYSVQLIFQGNMSLLTSPC